MDPCRGPYIADHRVVAIFFSIPSILAKKVGSSRKWMEKADEALNVAPTTSTTTTTSAAIVEEEACTRVDEGVRASGACSALWV